MSSLPYSFRVESNHPLFSRLKKLISSHVDLLNVASQWGVAPATLRRILAGGPISRFIQRKIGSVVEGPSKPSSVHRRRSSVERLLEVHRLYQERGTLQAVGDEVGLSRERVRQLLVKGSQIGLFDYKPSGAADIPKEKILEDYRRLLTLQGVAQANRVSISHLNWLLKQHLISDDDLREIRIDRKKNACLEQYQALVRSLGHHPTTTEMQRIESFRSLSIQIRKLWGSITFFRGEQGIPSPRRQTARSRRSDSTLPSALQDRGARSEATSVVV